MSRSPTTAETRWNTPSHREDPRHDPDSSAPTIRSRSHSAPRYVVPQSQNGPDHLYRREWSMTPGPPLASYPPPTPPNLHTHIPPPHTASVRHHASYGWNHPQPPWMSYPDRPHHHEPSTIPELPLTPYPPRSSVHQRAPPPLDPHARFPPIRINHHTSYQPPWMPYIPQTINRPDYPHHRQPSTIPESPSASYPSHSSANVQHHINVQYQRALPSLDRHARIPPLRMSHHTSYDWNHPQPPLPAPAAPWYDDTQPPPHTYGRPIPLPPLDENGDVPLVDYTDVVRPNVEGTPSSEPARPAPAECRCRPSAPGTSGLDAMIFSQHAACDCDVCCSPGRPSSEETCQESGRQRIEKWRRSVR